MGKAGGDQQPVRRVAGKQGQAASPLAAPSRALQ